MKVQALKLVFETFGNQWEDEISDRWLYADFLRHPHWRKGWISFDCAHYEAVQQRLYLGITSFDSDIFKAYDERTGEFIDLGYKHIADPFDAKFHRSLVRGKDGGLYAAVALLHDVDKHFEAPGGALIRYDLASGTIVKLCIPLPHVYIQSIALDDDRGFIYGLTFPPEKLVSYSLRTGEVKDLGLISSGINGMVQGENLAIDDSGCVWSSWGLTRAWQSTNDKNPIRLCKYDCKRDRIVFFNEGLPHPDGRTGYTVHPEGFMNLGDGCLYVSGANGSLYRVDPESGAATFLFMPVTRPSRLTSLAKIEEGLAFGVTGRAGKCELMCVNYRKGTFELLGKIETEDGESLWQCHHIVAARHNCFYICENDNPKRSSYVWRIEV